MEDPIAYIPMDRRQALAQGEKLPEYATGAALFADISGFTPLAEALALELGYRRGAEELTFHLNQVYNALIAELHCYRGSVITFGGDAITCWLDGDDGRRAVAAALAMQRVMNQFATVKTRSGRIVSLSMKAAAVCGPVRRFLVGDPDYLLVDVIAGATLDKLAATEHQANSGEVLVDEWTAEALGEAVKIGDWRTDENNGERFAVVTKLNVNIRLDPWQILAPDALDDEAMRSWLLPSIFDRLQRGQGEFLAELRPAVALFLRFSGIEYDEDEAADLKLESFIQGVERILRRYDGNLLQIMTGDKGSHLYAAFGAPVAHEDDTTRAAAAALDLQALAAELPYLEALQIGITCGRLRTGAYGSDSRRTYSVIGDAVNLSARLMAAARPGQILVESTVREAAGEAFTWEKMPGIRVKGKTERVNVWRLAGLEQQNTLRLRASQYSLPMVGRTQELALIEEKLELAFSSRGQIIGLTAEAGMGKSRLAAEVIRTAEKKGFITYGGECQSYGTNTSYLVWQNLWRGLLGLDPTRSTEIQTADLEKTLQRINPSLLPRMPLLGVVVGLSIPENDLTTSLDAKVRKSSLESLLVEILRAQTRTQSLLLVLEDCHWLDPLSHDLIEVIGRTLADLPVMMLMVYRPPDVRRLQEPRVARLDYFTEVRLVELDQAEAERLTELKLAQFYGSGVVATPALLEQINTRAAGNPFYVEELLNYLKDLGVDLQDPEALLTVDLPDSLHYLILARIDQLQEHQQVTIKVASVIGRLFEAAMLWGVYPKLGDALMVRANLDTLTNLELTQLATPEPELTYLFKHIITHQVAYESLLYSTRAMLHEQIGGYIERVHSQNLDQFVNLLAHHYEYSDNEEKKRDYLLKAGESAQREYANTAAVDYYEKVLPLLTAQEQVKVLLKLGKVLVTMSAWQQAGERFEEALKLSTELEDKDGQAWTETAAADLLRRQGEFDRAADLLTRARKHFTQAGDSAGVAEALHFLGKVVDLQGDYTSAKRFMQESLEIWQELGDQRECSYLLGDLGIAAARQGHLGQARSLFEQSLTLKRKAGDRWGVANVTNNLGLLCLEIGDSDMARRRLEEAVGLHRELGDRWSIGNALNNLGNVLRDQNDYETAEKLYDESLVIYGEMEERWALAYLLEDAGCLSMLQGKCSKALSLVGAAASLREQIGSPLTPAETDRLETALEQAGAVLSQTEQDEARAKGLAMTLEQAVAYARER